MIVLNMNKPENMAGSLADWTGYVNDVIIPIINEVKDTDNKVGDNLENTFLRFIKTNAMIVKKKELMDDYNGGPLPIITDEDLDLEELRNSIEFFLGIPMIFVGSKCDKLTQRGDSLMNEHVQYSLRKTALRYGSSLFLTSQNNSNNMYDLASYFATTLLEKKIHPEFGVTVRLELSNLVIPFGFDSDDLIEQLFGREEVKDYAFQSSNLGVNFEFRRNMSRVGGGAEKEIIPVGEFLKNCRMGSLISSHFITKLDFLFSWFRLPDSVNCYYSSSKIDLKFALNQNISYQNIM